MPAILFVVLGGGVIAFLMSRSSSTPPQGTPLPPVLPGQAPGTSFGPTPGMIVTAPSPGGGAPAFNPALFTAFTHHLGVQNLSSTAAPATIPQGHDVAPLPTPTPVQVPGVQHVMVATHDTGPTGNLAIRSAPSKTGGVLTEAPHGSVLAVTGANIDDPAVFGGAWSPVLQESSGIHGFSCTAYLKAI
jgi:hypothetical protein